MYRYNYICRYKHLNLERDMKRHEMGTPHIKRTVRIHRLAHHGSGQTLIEIARHYVGLFRCCFFECSKHRLLAACGFCGRRRFGGRWCFFVRSSKTYTLHITHSIGRRCFTQHRCTPVSQCGSGYMHTAVHLWLYELPWRSVASLAQVSFAYRELSHFVQRTTPFRPSQWCRLTFLRRAIRSIRTPSTVPSSPLGRRPGLAAGR